MEDEAGVSTLDLEEIRAEMDKIWWWHTMELAPGIVTPGHDPTIQKLPTMGMPEDLTGLTVADICAWDGFFAFEAERRGASRVMAVDHFCWSKKVPWGSKAGFDFAHRVLGSKVEERFLDVLDITPENTGEFDLVMLLGVLYHMRHPLMALEKVSAITRDMLILETHVDLTLIKRPAMAFYPGDELAHDPTNWFGPNEAAVVGMLKAVGFRKVECVSRTFPQMVIPDPTCPIETIQPVNRATFHAWK
jgi:tRNA (mo5U34)-methyltransferase